MTTAETNTAPVREVSIAEWEAAIEEHGGLVGSIVRDLRIRGEDARDAKQEGLIELRRVIEKFDPGRGIAFSTFCRRVILRRIIRWRKEQHSVRIPHSTLEKVECHRKDPAAPRPTPATVAAVERAAQGRPVVIDDIDDLSQRPDEIAATAEDIERLRAAALRIPAINRIVLISSAGLFGHEKTTFEAIADELDTDSGTVSNLKKQAIHYLRQALSDPSWRAPVTPSIDLDMARRAAVNELPPRLCEAISLKLGLDGEPMGNRAIALVLGVTRQRAIKMVRQATYALQAAMAREPEVDACVDAHRNQ